MSLALEILEQRKQAGAFGFRTLPSEFAKSVEVRGEWMRQQQAKNPLKPVAPLRPEQRINEPFPVGVLDAKTKSLANTTQIQDIARAVKAKGPPLAPPSPSREALNQLHTNTMQTLRDVETSRARTKTACADYPATEVLRLRAA